MENIEEFISIDQCNNDLYSGEEFLCPDSNDSSSILVDEQAEASQQQITSIQQLLSQGMAKQEAAAPLQTLLKAAKSREDQYEAKFPPTLLCTPYKYDLKVLGAVEPSASKKLEKQTNYTIELVDGYTQGAPEPSTTDVQQIKAVGVYIETIEFISSRERIIRFGLNWCSFHFKKRSFSVRLLYKGQVIFTSAPFHTYARRRDTLSQSQHTTVSKSAGKTKSARATPYPIPSPPIFNVSPPSSPPNAPASAAPLTAPGSPPHVSSPSQFMYPGFWPASVSSFAPMLVPNMPASTSTAKPAANGAVDNLLSSLERTSIAIQLMSSLSPLERQAVNYYLQGCNFGR